MTILPQFIRAQLMHVIFIDGEPTHAFTSWRLAVLAMLEAMV